MMWLVFSYTALVFGIISWLSYWVCGWMNPKCNGKLPPGSTGIPLIGETMEFFAPYDLYEITPFVRKRMARYGSLFRTNLVGKNVIVSTDPEINYQIFQQEGKSFELCYTESFMTITGESFPGQHGLVHKYLKNLVLQIIGPETLKDRLLAHMDKATRTCMRSWANNVIVDLKEVASNMIFDYFAEKLISYDESKASKKLKQSYDAFLEGLISFPLNIPGTAYHACLQGRKKAIKVIKDIYEERKRLNMNRGDYLDYLLEELKKEETVLNENLVIDLLFLLVFASYESTSSAITLAVKFISDHPQVLAELTKEHDQILRNRGNKDIELTWEEYKSMTFTHMVINETVRFANIVPVVFRRAVEDVVMKGKLVTIFVGYTIPKNWLVMVIPSAVHLNPDYYDNPLEFNPWRWEGKKLHAGSKTFMAFGGGLRLCVGADFTKLQVALVLHYLVSKYKWTVIKGGEIIRKPALFFPNGLHVKISEKEK
ncbi:Cytochrome P450, E-class, group I [Trema orientale]|uniref:Cytochrome P450, E-class, group I n=1 Tax=Trema orientale TaxID=63057 RepID=A0A2P5EI41_TREOI|nr:Cytochrome P450, E-class, group I [Trema orientale]